MGFLHQHPCRSLCHIHDFRYVGILLISKTRIPASSMALGWDCSPSGSAPCKSFSIRVRKTIGLARPGSVGQPPFCLRASCHFSFESFATSSRWSICASSGIGTSPSDACSLDYLAQASTRWSPLLPLFYQELMGYTALAAGWAVSPRGIGAIVAMPIIGYLTAKIDNRWLIAFGFSMFGAASLWFGEVNLSIGQ